MAATMERYFSGRTALELQHASDNFILFSNIPADVINLPERNGVIIGKIFDRNGSPQQVGTIPVVEGELIQKTAGRRLINKYWGSYVAAIASKEGTYVLRDPSGGLPCYYIRQKRRTIFSSDVNILLNAAGFSPEVDWEAVGQSLYFNQFPAEATALVGVTQIRCGEALLLGDTGIEKSQYWDPWDHIHGASASGEELAKQLYHIVRNTISTWAAAYPRALISLSGGLDSSIVASCLAAAQANIACVTVVTPDPVGDERVYARAVSQAIGSELIEIFEQVDLTDYTKSVAENMPMPSGKAHERAYNEAIREGVTRSCPNAFFVGAGGDNVFYLTHSARPLVDRFQAEGWSTGILQTLNDICTITGASAWQVIRESFRLTRMRNTGIRWHAVPDYLSPEFVKTRCAKPPQHPWLTPPDDVPLGKIGHVTMLLRAMNHLEHRDKSLNVPMISPLLSQPIMEFCLRVPSWEACANGKDRAVARTAFERHLPPAVIRRGAKGSPDGWVAQFIATHRQSIAHRLLDGELVRHGILDRSATEAILRPGVRLSPTDAPRLMALLDTEAWVRHWSHVERTAGEGRAAPP
ncbi:asparagine synthase-related protein [Sphingobium sp. H39-3-25]|uniref:asparagine synthase-related protein n=1 Tax=Sphingobium arseniciresistens TaxID=3030834 RepID=UPI0023BA07F5|nr:asparagine synthase-related protein [Sphingobium arseniciresistens]